MKRIVTAAALTVVLATPAAAAPPEWINLRDYWILGEIHNPETGERAVIRGDCSEQSPVRCHVGPTPGPYLLMMVRKQCGLKPPRGANPEHLKKWPEFIRVVTSASAPPGIVGFVASGAHGWAIRDQGYNFLAGLPPRAAPFVELRSAKGFSAGLSTRRGCEFSNKTDIRLTLWLVTPEELVQRDAAADTPAAKAVKAAKPALGGRGKRR